MNMLSPKVLIVIFLSLVISKETISQQLMDSAELIKMPTHQSRNKKIIIGGSSVLAFGSLLIYMKNAWWAENAKKFHFDQGRDLKYASNLDKMGHFMGGIITADAYLDAGKWIGMNDKKAAWLGFIMGTGFQAVIEIKDGYSPKWGFSKTDITAGTLGSLIPVLKQNSTFFKNIDFKFSYWQRTDKYFKVRNITPSFFHIDDYINQTYWVTTNLRYLAGQKNTWIPDWLGISFGWGNEAATWNPVPAFENGGRPEFYISPDIDFVKLFKPKKPFWLYTLKRLNYLKFPMPTLQLTQKVKLWPVYY